MAGKGLRGREGRGREGRGREGRGREGRGMKTSKLVHFLSEPSSLPSFPTPHPSPPHPSPPHPSPLTHLPNKIVGIFQGVRPPPLTLVPEVYFRDEETRQERERSGERKPLVASDANLTIMLR